MNAPSPIAGIAGLTPRWSGEPRVHRGDPPTVEEIAWGATAAESDQFLALIPPDVYDAFETMPDDAWTAFMSVLFVLYLGHTLVRTKDGCIVDLAGRGRGHPVRWTKRVPEPLYRFWRELGGRP